MIGLITDSHFYNRFSYGQYDDEGINSRLKDIDKIHQDFVDICIQKGVKHILHGGDLYHRRNPDQIVIAHSLRWMDKAVAAGIHIWMVPGNHDHNLIRDAFAALKMPNIINDKIHVITDFELLEIEDALVYAVPFVRFDKDTVLKVEQQIAKLGKNCLVFGHAQPEGAIPGVEIEFNEKEPMTLSQSALKDSDATILFGHIHDQQDFVLGSCVHLAFGEREDKYGWIDGEYIQLPQVDFVTVKSDYEADEDPVSLLEKLNLSKRTGKGFVRIVITNAPENYRLDIDTIHNLLPLDYRLVNYKIERLSEARVMASLKESPFQSLKESLETWQQDHAYQNTKRAHLEMSLLTEAEHI